MSGDAAIPEEMLDIDTHPVLAGAKILVVDDTPANLVAAEAALSSVKRQIVTAISGQDALACLLEQDFAVVILDVNMPEMDGFETARWIRSREKTQHLPIIFMTAHDAPRTSVLRAYELGAVDFLSKPFEPEVLRAKVSVFVSLFERTEQLALERIERNYESRRREFETATLRRERDREAEAKKELARLYTALAEHDKRKDSFIAILAHELRNPLAPLRTALDIARLDPTKTNSLIDVFERNTNTLVHLVDDLLDLSRIKADKIELRPEVVDLREVATAAVGMSRPAIEQRKHSLEISLGDESVLVVADSVRMTQVVCNLLNNASRYTNPGGRIHLEVARVDDDYARIRVTDNGTGIPSDLQGSIFTMFVQERVRSDGSGGLGLGLALSKRLVELHNGSISCRSAGRDQGSTFEVCIPRHGSPLGVPIRRRTRDMQPLVRPETRKAVKTIVIDDNDDARELVGELLRGNGFEVLTAADGETGIQLIREHQPDVAIVDLGLPVLDGFGVIEALRKDAPDLRTRLIALTGYGQNSDRERTRNAGFHEHLVKPVTASAIFDCVRRQLATH
jgi:signal transduction histidine kinase